MWGELDLGFKNPRLIVSLDQIGNQSNWTHMRQNMKEESKYLRQKQNRYTGSEQNVYVPRKGYQNQAMLVQVWLYRSNMTLNWWIAEFLLAWMLFIFNQTAVCEHIMSLISLPTVWPWHEPLVAAHGWGIHMFEISKKKNKLNIWTLVWIEHIKEGEKYMWTKTLCISSG